MLEHEAERDVKSRGVGPIVKDRATETELDAELEIAIGAAVRQDREIDQGHRGIGTIAVECDSRRTMLEADPVEATTYAPRRWPSCR